MHALAASFLQRINMAAPLPHAYFAARGAGLALAPTSGMTEPARLERGVLYFDESLPEYREHIADITCGVILRRAGKPDDVAQRHQLASMLGLRLPEDRETASREAQLPVVAQLRDNVLYEMGLLAGVGAQNAFRVMNDMVLVHLGGDEELTELRNAIMHGLVRRCV